MLIRFYSLMQLVLKQREVVSKLWLLFRKKDPVLSSTFR